MNNHHLKHQRIPRKIKEDNLLIHNHVKNKQMIQLIFKKKMISYKNNMILIDVVQILLQKNNTISLKR